ncbi:MAG: glycine zipper 2TM domain-containing protein [Brachymonas sp.]
MLRSRLVCVSTLTAAVLALGGCMMAPIGTTDNLGAISPYNPYPGYPSGTIPAPVTPGNYQGRGQVVNVQTLQPGGSASMPGSGAIIGGLAGGVIGNQIARNDRALGTIAGAAVGALIGNVIQQQQGWGGYAGQAIYRVTVRTLDTNNFYTFDYAQNPNVQISEYVQIQGNQLYRLQS